MAETQGGRECRGGKQPGAQGSASPSARGSPAFSFCSSLGLSGSKYDPIARHAGGRVRAQGHGFRTPAQSARERGAGRCQGAYAQGNPLPLPTLSPGAAGLLQEAAGLCEQSQRGSQLSLFTSPCASQSGNQKEHANGESGASFCLGNSEEGGDDWEVRKAGAEALARCRRP